MTQNTLVWLQVRPESHFQCSFEYSGATFAPATLVSQTQALVHPENTYVGIGQYFPRNVENRLILGGKEENQQVEVQESYTQIDIQYLLSFYPVFVQDQVTFITPDQASYQPDLTVFCKDFGACLKYERLYSQFNKSDAARRTLTCVFAILQQISRQETVQLGVAEVCMHKTIRIALESNSDETLFALLTPLLQKIRTAAPEIAEIFDAGDFGELIENINEALSCIQISLPNKIRFVSGASRASQYPHLTFSANLTSEVRSGAIFSRNIQKTQTIIESLTEEELPEEDEQDNAPVEPPDPPRSPARLSSLLQFQRAKSSGAQQQAIQRNNTEPRQQVEMEPADASATPQPEEDNSKPLQILDSESEEQRARVPTSSYLRAGSSQSQSEPAQPGTDGVGGQRNPRAVLLPVAQNMQRFQLKLQNKMSLREQLELKRGQKMSAQSVSSTVNAQENPDKYQPRHEVQQPQDNQEENIQNDAHYLPARLREHQEEPKDETMGNVSSNLGGTVFSGFSTLPLVSPAPAAMPPIPDTQCSQKISSAMLSLGSGTTTATTETEVMQKAGEAAQTAEMVAVPKTNPKTVDVLVSSAQISEPEDNEFRNTRNGDAYFQARGITGNYENQDSSVNNADVKSFQNVKALDDFRKFQGRDDFRNYADSKRIESQNNLEGTANSDRKDSFKNSVQTKNIAESTDPIESVVANPIHVRELALERNCRRVLQRICGIRRVLFNQCNQLQSAKARFANRQTTLLALRAKRATVETAQLRILLANQRKNSLSSVSSTKSTRIIESGRSEESIAPTGDQICSGNVNDKERLENTSFSRKQNTEINTRDVKNLEEAQQSVDPICSERKQSRADEKDAENADAEILELVRGLHESISRAGLWDGHPPENTFAKPPVLFSPQRDALHASVQPSGAPLFDDFFGGEVPNQKCWGSLSGQCDQSYRQYQNRQADQDYQNIRNYQNYKNYYDSQNGLRGQDHVQSRDSQSPWSPPRPMQNTFSVQNSKDFRNSHNFSGSQVFSNSRAPQSPESLQASRHFHTFQSAQHFKSPQTPQIPPTTRGRWSFKNSESVQGSQRFPNSVPRDVPVLTARPTSARPRPDWRRFDTLVAAFLDSGNFGDRDGV